MDRRSRTVGLRECLDFEISEKYTIFTVINNYCFKQMNKVPVSYKGDLKNVHALSYFNLIRTASWIEITIKETLKSKRVNFVLVSCETNKGLEELKEKIFTSFKKLRIYTRLPGRKEDKVPVIVNPNATLKDVAEKILHGYSQKVKYAKVWGPSAKFLGQKIGLKHVVKDKDIVEFYTE